MNTTKIMCESTLNVSLSKYVADIFEEGREFTRCAGILQNCLQILEKKVDKNCELSHIMKEAQIKRPMHTEEVNKFQI